MQCHYSTLLATTMASYSDADAVVVVILLLLDLVEVVKGMVVERQTKPPVTVALYFDCDLLIGAASERKAICRSSLSLLSRGQSSRRDAPLCNDGPPLHGLRAP